MAIRTSEKTSKFNVAFAKAQAKFDAAVKGNINPAFRSKYADVSSIIDATLEHLNTEGISIRQHPSFEFKGEGENREAFVTVTTRLTFEDEWEESDLSIPAVQRDRFDAQSCGSALTYGCRYALQGILVVRREDEDGNAATGRGTTEAAQAVAQEKIAKHKEKNPPAASNSVPSLFVAKQPSGLYAVTGHDTLLRPLYKQFSKAWLQQDRCYMVNEEELEQIKFQAEQAVPPVLITTLKGPHEPHSI